MRSGTLKTLKMACMLLLTRNLCSVRGTSAMSSTARSIRRCVKLFTHDNYEIQLPAAHRFPVKKYRMTRDILKSEYADEERLVWGDSPQVTREELVLTHCEGYVDRYLQGEMTPLEIRRQGFPWTPEIVDRSLRIVGGTVAATRAVLSDDTVCIAGNIAGGTHHAFHAYGEGFCIFSDIAVAANLALREFPTVRRVLIIDLDVHQGNGNAKLFQEDPRVFTFSMHCRENYFSEKQQSNIDIELEGGMGDAEYLSKLKTWLPYLFHSVQPDLVFFQAGVDIYEGDRLGKLKVSRRGLQQRNQLVFQYLQRRGVSCVVTMGGGYPKDLDPSSGPFTELLQNHADVYRCMLTTHLSHPSHLTHPSEGATL